MDPDWTSTSKYAPGFRIEIDGSELDPEAAYSILSLRVEQELKKTNAFNFQVQDEFIEGRFKWLESGLFQVASPVAVALGYAGDLVQVLRGKIQNINATFNTGQAPMFDVEGADTAYELLTTPSDTVVFRDKRDSDIVKEIVARIARTAPLSADVDPTEPVTAAKTKQGGKSFLEFLEGLAGENHYKLSLAGNRLYFKRESYAVTVAKLAWGRDLIRFEPQLNTTSAVTEVVVRAWDPSSKRQIEGRARVGDETGQESGKRTASEMAQRLFGDVVKVITDRAVRSAAEAKRIARAALEEASGSLVKATIEIVGNPELIPGTCVDIEGFGSLFSGKYYIVKATHTIGNDGYRSSLEVKRNTV